MPARTPRANSRITLPSDRPAKPATPKGQGTGNPGGNRRVAPTRPASFGRGPKAATPVRRTGHRGGR